MCVNVSCVYWLCVCVYWLCVCILCYTLGLETTPKRVALCVQELESNVLRPLSVNSFPEDSLPFSAHAKYLRAHGLHSKNTNKIKYSQIEKCQERNVNYLDSSRKIPFDSKYNWKETQGKSL